MFFNVIIQEMCLSLFGFRSSTLSFQKQQLVVIIFLFNILVLLAHNADPLGLPMLLRRNNPLGSLEWKIFGVGVENYVKVMKWQGWCHSISQNITRIIKSFVLIGPALSIYLKGRCIYRVKLIIGNILFEWCIRSVNVTTKNTMENRNSLYDFTELWS